MNISNIKSCKNFHIIKVNELNSEINKNKREIIKSLSLIFSILLLSYQTHLNSSERNIRVRKFNPLFINRLLSSIYSYSCSYVILNRYMPFSYTILF